MGVSTLEGEVIAGLILIIPVATTAVLALLQAYINKTALTTRPTHDEVSAKIQNAVNSALVQNGDTEGHGKV